MNNLLRIDTSSRVTGSHSRELGDFFVQAMSDHNSDLQVSTRDLVSLPIEPIHADTIMGFYTPVEAMTPSLKKATHLSDTLITELQSADILLLTVPMYNFSIPSALKAWIDQVVRIGQTFSYEDGQFTGLVTCKSAYVCVAYGASGYAERGEFYTSNFVEHYLRFLLKFLGIEVVHFISAEATTADDSVLENTVLTAKQEIARLLNVSIDGE